MIIEIKKILVKAYNNIKKIKCYYILLRYAYNIIWDEIQDKTNLKSILQMTIKAVNNIINPNDLILILLIFKAYLRMIKNLALSPSII